MCSATLLFSFICQKQPFFLSSFFSRESLTSIHCFTEIGQNARFCFLFFFSIRLLFFYATKTVLEMLKCNSLDCLCNVCSHHLKKKLVKPVRAAGSTQSTSKHRMEVNKINNITSTTTVHIILLWLSPMHFILWLERWYVGLDDAHKAKETI